MITSVSLRKRPSGRLAWPKKNKFLRYISAPVPRSAESGTSGNKKVAEIPLKQRPYQVGEEDLWLAIKKFYTRQSATDFFQIIERGQTLSYGILSNDQPLRLVDGSENLDALRQAKLIFISNLDRSKRPSAKRTAEMISERISLDDPAMRHIDPERVIARNKNQYWMEWVGPAAKRWWFLYNPFAIWPPISDAPASVQPHHMTFARGDSTSYQNEMHRFDNLWDVVSALLETNSKIPKNRLRFRAGINGWYYGESKSAPKAGATQSQAHAQFVRFPFPIEHAQLQRQRELDRVLISTIADGLGTGYVLESAMSDAKLATQWAARILQTVVEKENSFNVIVTPGMNQSLRLFLGDRERGTPWPHFSNEWGFSEFGRAVVVDVLDKFYEMDEVTLREWRTIPQDHQREWMQMKKVAGSLSKINATLHLDAKSSLNMVTAPQHQLDRVIRGL